MERCKGDFYVSLVRNLRFSRPSCTFSAWETYGSASGNVECGSRFVSLCRWILLFLCGDVSGGKLKNIKIKKHRQSSDYQCFLPVGVTGFEIEALYNQGKIIISIIYLIINVKCDK